MLLTTRRGGFDMGHPHGVVRGFGLWAMILLVACAGSPTTQGVVSVSIMGADGALAVGATLALSAHVVRVADAAGTVTWSSAHPAIATVDDAGVVYGVAPGEASITARSVADPSIAASVTVSVIAATAPPITDPPITDPPITDPPIASLVLAPLAGFAPLTVDLDASASSGSTEGTLSFEWDVAGDHSVGAARITRTFDMPGRHHVTVAVRDAEGQVSTATGHVTVGPFVHPVRIAESVGPQDYYNRHWVAHDLDTVLIPMRSGANDEVFTHVDVFTVDEHLSWDRSASIAPFTGTHAFSDVGRAVQLSGNVAAVMSRRSASNEPGVYETVIHVFERDDQGAWHERGALLRGEGVGTLVSYNADVSMALRDDVLVVGLPQRSGFMSVARVYVRDHGGPGAWGLAHTLPLPATAPDHNPGWFGTDVAVGTGGDSIAIAKSVQNNDGGLGSSEAAYVYERRAPDVDAWDLVRTLRWQADLPSPYSTYVEIDDGTLAVTHMPTVLSTSVEVAVFERDQGGAGAWGRVATQHVSLDVDDGYLPRHGHVALRLVDHTLAVGFTPVTCMSYGAEPPPEGGCGPGQVTLFGRDVGGPSAWGEAQVLSPPNGFEGQQFGTALSLSSDGMSLVVATSPRDGSDAPAEVFHFRR